ncbi:hypothetical protein HIM_03693 [Hirsutella minnesotensis 3608]|uniref:RNA polymerase I termination factor n=1 Tax=Hirsutella minnesotensis 3608 TaxID=1043627 RepID=A0A0F7ZLZ4_9HYPO|nr:hypothetical protein HIM_03693 [Hirsutella minnesotensis 3608]
MADVQSDLRDDSDDSAFDRWRSPSPIVFYNSNEPLPPLPESSKPKRSKSASKKNHKKSKKETTPRLEDPGSERLDSQGYSQETPGENEPHASEAMDVDEVAHSNNTTQQMNGDDAVTAKSTLKTTKKRKHPNSADGKRLKKKRAHTRHDAAEEELTSSDRIERQEFQSECIEAAAADFLLRNKSTGPVLENAVEEEVEGSDPQRSPTVARLHRRSQSREAQPRDNNVLPAEVDPMEALAQEAWNEHRQNQTLNADTQDAVEASTPHQTEPSASSPGRRRSSRKKSKPTFFEQPVTELSEQAAEANRAALAELPSPTAATPKRRNRAKKAAKKTAKGKKPTNGQELSPPPTQGVSEEDQAKEERPYRPRRNRLSGHTQGRFSDEELSRIARAVESFRAENDLTQEKVNQMIHEPGGTTAGESHAQLWVRIFAECPDRHRQKVINITRKKFHNFVARGTWTPEQDAELNALINVHGKKWSKIGAIINRHPEDLRDRYRNYLVCGENQRKVNWEEAEEARLTQLIIESMEAIDEMRVSKPNDDLVRLSYEELIDWQNISERMGRTRSRLQCITKWKSLNLRTHGKDKLVSGEPDAQISFGLEKARRQIEAMPDEEKYRLVLAIHRTSVGQDLKIPWQRLVDKRFRNAWHRPTLMLLWRRIRGAVPEGETMTTRDCAQYLVEQYNQSGELPDVVSGGFDDAEETEYIQSIPQFSGPASAHAQQDLVVSESEDEHVEGAADAGLGERQDEVIRQCYQALQDHQDAMDQVEREQAARQPDDIEIDPALTKVPAKKATTAKRTGSGKPPAWKRAKKAPTASMDAIEDIEQTQEEQLDHE